MDATNVTAEEIDRLFHDIEKALATAAELATEVENLRAVLVSFEIKLPNDDGEVWLHFHGAGTTGRAAINAAINLGQADRLLSQVARALEEDRRNALGLHVEKD